MKKISLILAVLALLGTYRAVQASIEGWSTTAASNNSASPDGFPENMAPSGLNNSAREVMAQVRRLAAQAVMSNWAPSSGTGTAYAVTPSIAWASYVSGQRIRFRAPTANTGALTLNVSGLGAISVVTISGTTLTGMSSGAFNTNQPVDVVYDGAHFIKISSNYADPLTTNGDLLYRSSGATTRLALGAENTFLTVSNSDVAWKTLSQHLDRIVAASQGALLYRGASLWSGLAVGTSGHVLSTQGANANPKWQSGVGTLTAGSTLTLSPYALTTVVTQAHLLGAEPTMFRVYLQNLVAELGYDQHQRVPMPIKDVFSTIETYNVTVDSTNVVLYTHSANLPVLVNKSTHAVGSITANNWALVIVPYVIN